MLFLSPKIRLFFELTDHYMLNFTDYLKKEEIRRNLSTKPNDHISTKSTIYNRLE